MRGLILVLLVVFLSVALAGDSRAGDDGLTYVKNTVALNDGIPRYVVPLDTGETTKTVYRQAPLQAPSKVAICSPQSMQSCSPAAGGTCSPSAASRWRSANRRHLLRPWLDR